MRLFLLLFDGHRGSINNNTHIYSSTIHLTKAYILKMLYISWWFSETEDQLLCV